MMTRAEKIRKLNVAVRYLFDEGMITNDERDTLLAFVDDLNEGRV